jgi:hypothetical protein
VDDLGLAACVFFVVAAAFLVVVLDLAFFAEAAAVPLAGLADAGLEGCFFVIAFVVDFAAFPALLALAEALTGGLVVVGLVVLAFGLEAGLFCGSG